MTDDDADGKPRRFLFDIRETVHEMRAQVRSEMVSSGGVSTGTQEQFAAVLLTYRDALTEFRDEAVLDPEWDERGVDWIERASRQRVRQASGGGGGIAYGGDTESVPKLVAIDIDPLLEVSHQLDEIAKDLGFAAETRDHTPDNEWTKGDLINLVTLRDQPASQELIDAWWPEKGREGAVEDEELKPAIIDGYEPHDTETETDEAAD